VEGQGPVFEVVRAAGVFFAFASAVTGAPVLALNWWTQLCEVVGRVLRRRRSSRVTSSLSISRTVERPNWLDLPDERASTENSLTLLWQQHERLFKEVGHYAELDQERMRNTELRLTELSEAVDRRATEAQVHADRLGRSALPFTVLGLVVSTYAAELATWGWPAALLAIAGAVWAVTKAWASVRRESAVRGARSDAEEPSPG